MEVQELLIKGSFNFSALNKVNIIKKKRRIGVKGLAPRNYEVKKNYFA